MALKLGGEKGLGCRGGEEDFYSCRRKIRLGLELGKYFSKGAGCK